MPPVFLPLSHSLSLSVGLPWKFGWRFLTRNSAGWTQSKSHRKQSFTAYPGLRFRDQIQFNLLSHDYFIKRGILHYPWTIFGYLWAWFNQTLYKETFMIIIRTKLLPFITKIWMDFSFILSIPVLLYIKMTRYPQGDAFGHQIIFVFTFIWALFVLPQTQTQRYLSYKRGEKKNVHHYQMLIYRHLHNLNNMQDVISGLNMNIHTLTWSTYNTGRRAHTSADTRLKAWKATTSRGTLVNSQHCVMYMLVW